MQERPELEKCSFALRSGDTLTAWCLDPLGLILKDSVGMILDLGAPGVGFRLNGGNNIVKRSHRYGQRRGKLVFQVFAALAEFERSLIREQTVQG